MSLLGELAWKALEKGARLADAYFDGWTAAKKRWNETQKQTQERHASEDAAWRASRPTTTDGRKKP